MILILLLAVAGVVLNGPGSRWIIKDQIHKFAAEQDLEGSFTLEGTIISGYIISDLKFSGDGGVKQLEVGELKLSYSLEKLIDKEIDAIEIDKVVLVTDLDDFPSKTEEKESETDLKELLASIKPIVTAPKIEVLDVDVTIKKGGEGVVTFQWESFAQVAKSGVFDLSGLAIQEAQLGIESEPQDIRLEWGEHNFSIKQFVLMSEVGVRASLVDWSEDLLLETDLFAGQALAEVRLKDKLSVVLREGTFCSQWLEQKLGLPLPASFELKGLNAEVDDYRMPIPEWRVAADIELESAKYENYSLSNFNILLGQKDGEYTGSLNGDLNQIPLVLNFGGVWQKKNAEKWWEYTAANFSLDIQRLEEIPSLWVDLPEELKYQAAKFEVDGDFQMSDLDIKTLNVSGNLSGVSLDEVGLPSFDLKANMNGENVAFNAVLKEAEKSTIQLEGSYLTEQKEFVGNLEVLKPNPIWLNAVIHFTGADVSIDEGAELSWKGKGNITDSFDDLVQEGNLVVKMLEVELAGNKKVRLVSDFDYSFPDAVDMKLLKLSLDDWKTDVKFNWDGKRINVPQASLKYQGVDIAKLKASLPYNLEIQDLEGFLNQTDDWDISIKSEDLSIQKIEKWAGLDLPIDITGRAKADFQLHGSPSHPNIKGAVICSDLRGIDEGLKEPVYIKANIESLNKKLKFNTVVREKGNELLSLNGSIPFTPLEWVQQAELIEPILRDTPIKAELKVNNIPLNRASHYLPELAELDGGVSAKGVFTGTLNEPQYQLEVDADLPKIVVKDFEVERITNVKLKSSMNEDFIVSSELKAQINGGDFSIKGDVDITDLTDPVFDFNLKCDYAQIYRNDFLSSRANVDINLKGTIADALVSGDVGIVESLFYKDIELIPIGVPSSEVAEVKLPAVNVASDDELPIPAPFDQWKMDVTVKTEDPFQIRGNIARGKVEGGLRLTGLLKKPTATGTFFIKKIKAKLPFSVLRVANGEVIFDESTGLMNPKLKINGTSEVGNHKINLLVHGNVSSPGTSLSSSPPLPEPDIMSLLATGSTTSGLENNDAVALKALQVFLIKMEERKTVPGGNKLFGALLSAMKKLNLEAGKEDRFTGSTYTSASVDITPNWLFTTQVDAELETRGLLVYLVRFR